MLLIGTLIDLQKRITTGSCSSYIALGRRHTMCAEHSLSIQIESNSLVELTSDLILFVGGWPSTGGVCDDMFVY